jgi:thimet oligopeptidase
MRRSIGIAGGAAILLCALTGARPLAAQNPFLTKLNEPIAYGRITAAHVTEFATLTLDEATARAKEIRTASPARFDNVVGALDAIVGDMTNASLNSYALYWVSPDSSIRAAGLAAYQRVDSAQAVLLSDPAIFSQVVAVQKSEQLTGPRGKLVADLVRDMRHAGAELSPAARLRFSALRAEVIAISSRYSTNMNTDIPVLELTAAQARGLPDGIKSAYAKGDSYRIPVLPATSAPMLNNAEDEETRRRYFMTSNQRAAAKNLPVLDTLIRKRYEQGQLMGHRSFAEYNLEVNMADKPQKVWSFLDDLIRRTRDKASADLRELQEIQQKAMGAKGGTPVQPWNVGYLQNTLLKTKFDVDAEQIREYLPLSEALRGMMDLYQELLGYKFRRLEKVSVWHPEVEAYEVLEDGKVVGRFYLDLFPRPNKESWFYGVSLTPGRRRSDGYQIPVVMLLGNFTRATADRPSLVTHADLLTLFHEFGHVMESVSYRGDFAMQGNPAADFSEAMSQIFEDWIWDYDVLKTFARHYKTGEVLPKATFDRMLAARSVSSGLNAQRRLRSAVYDMMVYDTYDPARPMQTDSLWKQIAERFVYAPYVEGSHEQASWIHINAYPTYYYGYLWSNVYSQDMFTQFKTNGLRNSAVGKRYRQLILANGSQRPIEDAVAEFLGRPMNSEAYIRSLGLKAGGQ